MTLLLFVSLAFADPTLARDGVYEGDAKRVSVETTSTGPGSSHTAITTPDGQPVATLMLLREGGGTSRARADFPTLGVFFEARFPVSKPDDVLLSWVKNGLVGPDGAHLDAVQKYCADRGLQLVGTAASVQRMQAAAAAAPPASTPPASKPPPASTAAAKPPPPSVVSIQLHVECDQKVRLYTGSSGGSGTYGWESPNSVRSTSLRPGTELCIADERDQRKSCWTVGDRNANLEIGCSGFRTR